MQPFQRIQRPAVLATAGVLLFACLRVAGASALEQTDWQLAQYRTDTGMTDAVQSDPPAVMRFEDGRITGSAGCNRLMRSYTLDGDELQVSEDLATTMMACPAPLMAQEQAVTGALTQTATYAVDDDGLTLEDAAGEPLLTFTELESSPLTGTIWQLTQYNNGHGGVTGVLPGTNFVLMLSADGQMSGKACNTYRGGYVAEGSEFSLEGPIAATRMLCQEPQGIDDQEAAYFAALERAAAYRIHGDELTLSDADGATLAVFRAAGPGA